MLDIVFLSATHRWDDTRILHKEARALRDAGHRVTHLCPETHDPAPEEVGGVKVTRYPSVGRGRLGRIRECWKAARAARADVYHCNEVESWLLGCALKLLRPGTRIVFDVHEHYPSRFQEGRFPWWLKVGGEPVLRALFFLLTPWTDHVVFAKRSVVGDFRTRPGRGTLIFNYAPLRITLPARDDVQAEVRALFDGAPTAVHIGGFSRERGWPQLLEALRRTEDPTFRVVALGDVVEGIDTLMAEATRLGVASRVVINRRVPYQELFGYLLCADVGLMLYQPGILNHVYAFPMKLYDYMLAGLPVIGPDFAPEVTPVVTEERIGWLIDTADPGALARALDAVARDRAAARAMGARGQAAVRRTYNWEREAEKLVAIYAGFETGRRSVTQVRAPAARAESTSTGAASARP